MTTFTVYVLTGNQLTAAKAFVALSLFGIMRFPLGFFPDVIASCIQVVYLNHFKTFVSGEFEQSYGTVPGLI